MPRTVNIGAVQLPTWTEGTTAQTRKAWHLAQIEHWLHAAGRAGVDIVCFGETATTYGVHAAADDADIFEDAYHGPAAQLAARLARDYAMAVVLPIAARDQGRLHNLALVFDRRGNITGHYAKVHPTRTEMAQGIEAGDSFPVFDLDFGRIGICICHDLSFPESTRALALGGAEIIFWPHWWSGWGEELCTAVIKSRAIDNAAYLVQVSFGQPDGKAWRPGLVLGNSGVVGPDGLILSSAGRYVGLSQVTIDLDKPRIAHCFSVVDETVFRDSMLADRRPDAYAIITDASRVPSAASKAAPVAVGR
ncbi:MAG: carbon-nitrogen hydrolase family protein [Chloroflexota bacterium]